jgi:hypothetical protein
MVDMKLGFLSKSRGIRNLISRIITVLCRFGLSSKRFEKRLKKYYEITNKADCLPTFAITAIVLARNPDYIKELSRKGVEFAVHGYVHIDYKVLSIEEKNNHFKKAIDIFNMNGIPFVGFRAPFLRVNSNTTPILSNLGFLYHSSRVLYWPVIDINKFSAYARNNHNLLMEFCAPLDPEKYLSLPKFENGLIEIPVSLPDDETIIERLGIYDKKKISEIWLDILQRTYERSELFILSLHPERIEHCDTSLAEVLRKVRGFNPSVWVATLEEIAEWWRERAGFNFKILSTDKGRYSVHGECSNRAIVMIKNARVNVPVENWFDGYQIINHRDFILESPKRPVIGVSSSSSPVAVNFLKSEGYIVEVGDNPDDYSIFLDNLKQFDVIDEKPLSRKIEQSDAPLLRFWRWPNKSRSALSITGDIDSMTITDFALRILENRRHQGWVHS